MGTASRPLAVPLLTCRSAVHLRVLESAHKSLSLQRLNSRVRCAVAAACCERAIAAGTRNSRGRPVQTWRPVSDAVCSGGI